MKHEHFEDAQKQAMNVRLVHCVVPVHYTLYVQQENEPLDTI